MSDRIFSFREKNKFIHLIKTLKNENKSLVTTNGCFDILHHGHLELLLKASLLGTLIVGLNSDSSVKQIKDARRPIFFEMERARMLLGYPCVDFVYIFDESDASQFLSLVSPQTHVKDERCPPNKEENEVLAKNQTEVVLFKHLEGISTTDIINRILERYR